MIEDREKALTFVLRMEGGYTLDPNDPGGETVFGIARNRNAHWKGWELVDRLKTMPNYVGTINTNLDLLNSAKDFYLEEFWKACSCDDLPMAFAISVFDTAVNQGVSIAKRLLQMSLDVEVDGIIGPQTIAAASKADRSKLKLFLAHRLAEYARLMAAKSHLLIYAFNWSHRVISLADLVLNQHDEPGCIFNPPKGVS